MGGDETALPVCHAHALKPDFEFRRAPQPENLAYIELVVEGRGLVVQHDVVRARNPDDVIYPRRSKKRQKRVHVVLIRFGMVGVADVATHRYAHELAAEMVLEARADDLLAVV